MLYLAEASLTPFIIMIVTISLTLNQSFKSRNKLKRYLSTENLNSLLQSEHKTSKKLVNIKSSDLKFAFNSIVFNILFIILTAPTIFVHLYHNDDFYFQMKLKMSAFIIFTINFASRFWIHFCINSIFRNEILVILRIK